MYPAQFQVYWAPETQFLVRSMWRIGLPPSWQLNYIFVQRELLRACGKPLPYKPLPLIENASHFAGRVLGRAIANRPSTDTKV